MIKISRLIFTVFFIVLIINFSSAATTKLLCVNEGDKVLFSKCNPSISDRTCTTSQGCRYCVNKISPGIYCPTNLNQCNGEGFTCQQNLNPNNLPVNNNQDSNLNNPSNTNTNTQTNRNTSTNPNYDSQINTQTSIVLDNNKLNKNQLENENPKKSLLISGNTISNNLSLRKK